MTVEALRSRFYPSQASRDPASTFIALLDDYVRPEFTVLDVGAGAGELHPYSLRNRVREMIGVDLDRRVMINPLLDRRLICDASKLPIADESVDLAFSIYVQEHIADPKAFARELFRVLKPGGRYLSLTPNRFHYVPLIASVTPHSFHRWLNEKRGRDRSDTFPAHYRLNTVGDIRKHFGAAGFSRTHITAREFEPHYLTFSPVTYAAGVLYERAVNTFHTLERFRVNLTISCVK